MQSTPEPRAIEHVDNDEFFGAGEVNGPVNESSQLRDGLDEIQSQMDPNIRRHLQQMGDSLNNTGPDRIQPLQPEPNEDQPIRRVSVVFFKNFFIL